MGSWWGVVARVGRGWVQLVVLVRETRSGFHVSYRCHVNN